MHRPGTAVLTTLLLALATACSTGEPSGSGPNPPPAPVASVAVSPPSATILVGATTGLQATPKDAAGNPLSGRPVTWTSTNQVVATVSATGEVKGVTAGGPVTITATSEGQAGTAQVTVLAPVASVLISGTFRTKVRDLYQYDATARLADGTVVTRPTSWSVAEPGLATMTADGQMTPLQTGTITVQVTVEGVLWEATATAYDWLAFGSGSTFGVSIPADLTITNKFGSSEYPELAMGCSGGLFLLFVDTEHFVTESGLVAYGFDAQAPESAVWLEFDLFSALGHPGPSNATRGFAARMGMARRFGFAFIEFNGPAVATIFRVTGLQSRLTAFSTCAAPAPLTTDASAPPLLARLQAMVRRPSRATAERALRAELRAARSSAPAVGPAPALDRALPGPETRLARRRPTAA